MISLSVINDIQNLDLTGPTKLSSVKKSVNVNLECSEF